MLDIKEKKIQIGDKEAVIKVGEYALQANGSITLQCGETLIHAVATMGPENPDLDFFPLTVEYNENLYAGGKIKSSRFLKRQGRPADDTILKCRLIDRSIRPLFPKTFKREVQVVVSVLASDKKNPHDVLGLTAAIVALAVSDIPFDSNLAGLRMSKVDGELVVNPHYDQCERQEFELVLAGNSERIAMIECAAQCADDEEVLKAFELSYKYMGEMAATIEEFRAEVGKPKIEFVPVEDNNVLLDRIKELTESKIDEFSQKLAAGEVEKKDYKEIVLDPVLATFTEEEMEETFPKKEIVECIDVIFKKKLRYDILDHNKRLDGRGMEDIRELQIKTGVVPRVHGSAMFMRGETQVLNILTLGAPGNGQLLETIEGESEKRYMHHYNAPPYSVGETGRMGGPGRREIGHGGLAEKALLPVIPNKDDFSYVMLLTSEVMGQNGSSSMASTCASTLSLMDGGIPIKAPVAGISIGLMTDEASDRFVTITDIIGSEDFGGDMDFKVAGTYDAITAIQMDTKIKGLTFAIVEKAIRQAKAARTIILDKITQHIAEPRANLSQYAPKIEKLKVPVDMISKVIGPGGKVIKALQADYEVDISIEDDGSTCIAGDDMEVLTKVKEIIHGIVSPPDVGKVYKGKIVKLFDFGAVVEIFPGKEGLVHISRISKEHVKDVNSVVELGQEVEARLFEIDSQGRLNFTMILDEEAKSHGGGGGGGRRNDRRDRNDRNDRNDRRDRNDRNDRRDRRDRNDRDGDKRDKKFVQTDKNKKW